MIFKSEADDFHLLESYKERNLYYKIFGGYFFNELIADSAKRKEQFINLTAAVSDNERVWDPENKVPSFLKNMLVEKDWGVTFDYHTAQVFQEDKREDRGEMSDVLVLSKTKMISIECKFLSNFSIQKDIKSVQDRIDKFSSDTRFKRDPLQLLLLKKSKWENSAKFIGKLETLKPKIPIVVIFWEDLNEIIENESVKKYLTTQINRK